MGTVAGRKNSANQVPEIVVAYPTTASDATHKAIHSHRSLSDERYSHGIRCDNALSFSKTNRIKAENRERNGHPETNAAPRDVKKKHA